MQFDSRKRAEITVFMTLIMSIYIMFAVSIIGSIRRYVAKNEIVTAMDNALFSCFGEYNKYLYERYHLMYIDPSYKSDISNPEELLSHFETYMQANMKNGNQSVTTLTVCNVTITDIKYATDNNCDDMYKQIQKYCMQNENISVYEGSMPRKVLYEYIVDKFSDSSVHDQDKVRSGEIEYIIYGKDTDYQNIEKAYAEYEEYIQELYGELSIINNNIDCMGYSDYLLMKLEKMTSIDMLMRLKNLINENLKGNGSNGMCFDDCIYSIELSVDVASEYGFDYSIKRAYRY